MAKFFEGLTIDENGLEIARTIKDSQIEDNDVTGIYNWKQTCNLVVEMLRFTSYTMYLGKE